MNATSTVYNNKEDHTINMFYLQQITITITLTIIRNSSLSADPYISP